MTVYWFALLIKAMSGPFDPYYDYSPRRLLSRPLVLCGYYGSGVPELSFALSAQTGIPLHDIERQLEHRIGKRLISHQSDLESLEHQLIRQVLQQTPYGIIMLRPQSLKHPPTLKMIQERAQSIYIQRDIFVLFANLLDIRRQADHNRYCPLPAQLNINLVQQDLNQYKPSYQKLNHTIRAMNTHPVRLCPSVLSYLDANA